MAVVEPPNFVLVDPRQHDERRDRIQFEGKRQQHRDSRQGADPPAGTPTIVPTKTPIKQ